MHVILNSLNNKTIKEVKRLIKSILFGEHEIQGRVPLHAGMVTINHTGIVMIGSKGSGKTSFVLSCLANNANYVSNDLLFIGKGHGASFHAVGAPESIRVGIGTLKQHERLSHLVPDKYKYIHNSDELWLIPKEEKVEIEWYDLNQYFNTQVQVSLNNVDIVVCPILTKRAQSSITPLSQSELLKRLLSNNLSTYSNNHVGPWLDIAKGDKAQMDLMISDTFNQLSRSIKAYEVQFDSTIDSVFTSINKLTK